MRSKVIEVLQKTLQPSIKEFKSKFNCKIDAKDAIIDIRSSNIINTHEIFRHQLYSEFFILDKKTYEDCNNLSFEMSYIDPFKGARVIIEVGKKDFNDIPEGSTLTKIAAHYKIKELEMKGQSSFEVSIKHQVLAKKTAMVGVVKNLTTKEAISSMEMKQVTINEESLNRMHMLQ